MVKKTPMALRQIAMKHRLTVMVNRQTAMQLKKQKPMAGSLSPIKHRQAIR
jgi:hypothetical protein